MDKRKLGLALVVAGAALIALGVLQRNWWAGEVFSGASVHIGVRSIATCVAGACRSEPLSTLAGTAHGGWASVGGGLFFIALVASAILLLVGGLAVARVRPYWPVAPTTLGFLLSAAVLILGVLFVLLKPKGLHGTGLQAGTSLFILIGGGVAGLMGSLFCAQSNAAVADDDWA